MITVKYRGLAEQYSRDGVSNTYGIRAVLPRLGLLRGAQNTASDAR